MKSYVEVDVWIQVFLTLELVGGGQLHEPAALLPGKEPSVPIGPQNRSGRRGEE
jgi:hypothetical protein